MVESAVHPVHHAHRPVSLGDRRGPITMGLLWITMATGFPTVLVGFEWFRLGITLPQVVVCSVVGIVVLLAYTIPTVNLAAATGKGYGLLNESVFGKGVSALINAILILMFIGFYGLAALFMAEGINSLFGCTIPLAFLAAGLAVLMALNNFFGFSGVANFARFFRRARDHSLGRLYLFSHRPSVPTRGSGGVSTAQLQFCPDDNLNVRNRLWHLGKRIRLLEIRQTQNSTFGSTTSYRLCDRRAAVSDDRLDGGKSH